MQNVRQGKPPQAESCTHSFFFSSSTSSKCSFSAPVLGQKPAVGVENLASVELSEWKANV